MTARNIPGWSTDIDAWQTKMAARIPKGGTYLEVGVFLGSSLAKMGELRPDISLIAVDPWEDAPAPGWVGSGESIFAGEIAPHGGLFMAFLYHMQKHAADTLRRTKVIRGTTRTVRILETVDFLFIDGAHDEASVASDLAWFAPRVRMGGIISGHDYTPDFPGVIVAVDEYFDGKPRVEGVCWWKES